MDTFYHQFPDDYRFRCDRNLGWPPKRIHVSTVLFTIYKICDIAFVDNFLLLKFHFFQYYYPEAERVMVGRKYGFNIRSQLLKLLVIFPAVSALAAWICTLV